MKYIEVTFSDHKTYRIPASFIASRRADYYAYHDVANMANGQKKDDEWHKLYKEEFDFTMEDDYELIDWAFNNMDWEDVEDVAELVDRPIDIDYNREWTNADIEVVEEDEDEESHNT